MTTEPSAKIIADSINESGDRLTTMEIECHRFVLAEFNTHRVYSRNSASSRAIPVEKQLKRVTEDPAYPLVWASEMPGMQGGLELTGLDLELAQEAFELAQETSTAIVQCYLEAVSENYPGLTKEELKSHTLHKSLLNRLIEPLMWHKIIITSTDYINFFNQRCSPLAQPEIRAVADKMLVVYTNSSPEKLDYGVWHLPYISSDEYAKHTVEECMAISAARCARVSYLTHDGLRDPLKDIELYEKLVTADPPHWSPLEHVATPAQVGVPVLGNFTGWQQLRHYKGN